MDLQCWYLYNSAFVLKTKTHCFIFDYYPYEGQPVTGDLDRGRLDLKQIRDFGLPVIVFVSHSHYDHYDSSIFEWKWMLPDVKYVLSSDVPARESILDENVLVVEPNHGYQFQGMGIQTLSSTDQGVAFLIRAQGFTLYHAGDLNFWDWEGESPVYRKQMEQDYKEQIDFLKGETIDLAFVPLDGRLEGNYWKGLDYYMRTTQTRHVVPMHFRQQYEVFDWLKEQPQAQDYLDKVQILTHRGQSFQVMG